MKRIFFWAVLFVLTMSCGNKETAKSVEDMLANKDVEALKEKQSELQDEYNNVTAELSKIREALDKLANTKQLPIVTTFKVLDTTFLHEIEIQGSVDTRNNTMLFSEFSGVLTHLYIAEGQNVVKGQLIARVDDGGLGQQLGQAEVNYDLAKTTFERQARLWEKKIGSEIQYLQAKTTMKAAEKAVMQIKAQLNKTTIRAPFSGVIDDVPVKQGAVILPGQTPIARIVNLNNMYVRADLSESYLGKIKVGTAVNIRFPAIGKELVSKIRQVGNFINPNNRTFYIEIGVPNREGTIKPNLMATLTIADYKNDKALIVPENIVQEDGEGNSYIFTIVEKEGKLVAEKHNIKKGLTQGAFVEIIEGLTSGMEVINEGSQSMQDGLVVEVKR